MVEAQQHIEHNHQGNWASSKCSHLLVCSRVKQEFQKVPQEAPEDVGEWVGLFYGIIQLTFDVAYEIHAFIQKYQVPHAKL